MLGESIFTEKNAIFTEKSVISTEQIKFLVLSQFIFPQKIAVQKEFQIFGSIWIYMYVCLRTYLFLHAKRAF